MKIKEIALTAYPAADVATLRDWYRDTLGLTFDAPYEEDGVLKYDAAEIAGGYFGVITAEWSERGAGSAESVTFEVSDLEAARRELEGKGVKVADIHDTPVCRMFHVDDPEGNRFALHQITVPH